MKKKLLIIGSSGMAGHVLTLFLREVQELDVIDVGPRRNISPKTILGDLEDPACIRALIRESRPDVVLNCTGVLVKASEESKRTAVWFNSYLPHYISEICQEYNSRFIHLGTDCVFSGRSGPYSENSFRDGNDFYGRSKALGEVVEGGDLTIRTSIIGPELRLEGTGLLHWFLNQKGEVTGFRHALWSGVTTLELARFLAHTILENENLSGLVHYAVPGGISKYQLLQTISAAFGIDRKVVAVDAPKLDKRLENHRDDLGMVPLSYKEQLEDLFRFMKDHRELYTHYPELT